MSASSLRSVVTTMSNYFMNSLKAKNSTGESVFNLTSTLLTLV